MAPPAVAPHPLPPGTAALVALSCALSGVSGAVRVDEELEAEDAFHELLGCRGLPLSLSIGGESEDGKGEDMSNE